MIIRGGGGWGGVLTSLTSTSFTLRKMQTLHMLSVVSKIIPTKGSSWPKSTTNKISLLRLRLIIFEVVCGINPIEPLLLVPNKWMEHGNTWKNGDLRRCSTKKTKRVQKKVHLGLQLDMASQRCLVAECGFCIATSALALLASRRGKNWKSECRPDMTQMIENHKFLMFFSWPLKSKIESPRRRNAHFHSWVTRLPIEMNVHVANIFWRLLQIPAFCLLASKIRISNSSPLQGRRVNRLPSFLWSHFFWVRFFYHFYRFLKTAKHPKTIQNHIFPKRGHQSHGGRRSSTNQSSWMTTKSWSRRNTQIVPDISWYLMVYSMVYNGHLMVIQWLFNGFLNGYEHSIYSMVMKC